MRIDWWTLALQAVNVLILVWLLGRFLYRPVMRAIEDRQQAAARLLADAQAAKDAALAEAATLQEQSDSFAAQNSRNRTQMQAEADAERARLLAQARDEAAAVVRAATADADTARARLRAELVDDADRLALQVAEKLLRRLSGTITMEALFQALLEHLRGLPEEQRRRLVADAPLQLVTALPIDAASQARYRETVGAVLGAPLELQCVVDPALIAGCELRGPHLQISNSWRADLDALYAALRADGHELSG